ncbi:MAG: hypothetical protein HYS27_13105 [Deltaproteobacteria bacterium]|nr:hypothetical protein [Deltaproteobacteria bacterium]
MLVLLCLIAAQVPPPDPAGVPPPPPLLADDPADDPALPTTAPTDTAPTVAPSQAPASPPDPPPLVVTRHDDELLPRPLRGGLATAAGAGLGAAAGASFLLWGALAPGTPVAVLLLAAVATPALSAFLAGSLFVAFAIERPTVDDWGMVAGCTAVGCLALGLIVLGGAGGLGSIGTGCDVPSSCCGSTTPASSSSRGDEGAIWATAGGGLGAAIGLGVGALAALTMLDATPNAALGPTLAASAGAGMVIGALAGGALGGAIAGTRDDDSFEREQATRPAPARAGRPR